MTPKVHLLCGLNGAGKTTYARQLERELPAVRFSLDEWMLRLFPELPYSGDDYGRQASVCKDQLWTVALQVLATGTDVVLDWNQWSRRRRTFWKERANSAGYEALLHHIATPLDAALARSRARSASEPAWAHNLADDDVRHLASIFEAPADDEGLQILTVG
ncbi:hypothetical protein GCM10027403_08040 [Arthrobacter tecti]